LDPVINTPANVCNHYYENDPAGEGCGTGATPCSEWYDNSVYTGTTVDSYSSGSGTNPCILLLSCNDPEACNYLPTSPNNADCEYTSCNPQTGTGVIIFSDPNIAFDPTPQDSAATIEIAVYNDVGAEQTINFTGFAPPFDANPSELILGANDTGYVDLTFTPGSTGSFTQDVTASGSVFGEASLSLSGEGTLVSLAWSGIDVNAGVVALGQTGYAADSLVNTGTGTASILLTNDSVQGPFTLTSYPTSFSGLVSPPFSIEFNPVNAGGASAIFNFATNDPANPNLDIFVTGTGISEVSGEVCDITWTASNSPYTLTGDITVPEGCTLTLEPGTEVIGNNNNIEVFGAFFANGEEGNEVQIEVGELLSHTAAENMVLTHSTVTETNEFYFPDGDFRDVRDANSDPSVALSDYLDSYEFSVIYNNENAASHVGKYSEDFSDNNGQGWTHSGNVSTQNENGDYYLYHNCCANSGAYYNLYIETPTFNLNPGENVESISFRKACAFWLYTRYFYVYISIDGGGWEQIFDETNPSNSYTNTSISTDISNAATVRFRFHHNYQYYGGLRIDDFVLTTNFYPGEDVPVTAAAGAAASLSTGGIQLVESTYNGDFHSVGDSIEVVLENSAILVNEARDKDSHGLGLYADHVNLTTTNSTVNGHGLDGIHIESLTTEWSDQNGLVEGNGEDGVDVNGDLSWNSSDSEVLINGADGIVVSGDLDLDATELDLIGNGANGLDVGEGSNLTLYGVRIQDNGGRGIGALAGCMIDLDYVLIDDNVGRGIDMGANGQLSADYLRICDSGEEGIYSASSANISHSNIGFNTGTATVFTGNNFHTLDNSILWGNNTELYKQVDLEGGILSTSYSLIQGLSTYGVGGAGQYSLGEGLIEVDPLLADEEMHLQVYSPCVDGAQPWTQDQHMPYGLGGVRADMGMYGGPANAYWGGEALPDGSSVISAVSDSPQDQGNTVGLTFSGSYYDNSDLVNNVTHYAFWRHYDPTGQPVASLADGNWELLGTMPSQSFAGYAYQAATLGNTNDTGPFTSCYTVVAHTDDPDTYWYSNVMCGESVDNLAPLAPDLNGMVLEDGSAELSWAPPGEEDYGYTELTSDAGFFVELSADTLVVDATVMGGNTYTYTAVHYDVNGNASPPAQVTLAVGAQRDVIPLSAGWNLISLDRAPLDASVDAVMADLAPSNLLYVTGFDAGASFYDPAGLPFLNTLSSLEDGYGYWIKVAADDTLRVEGASLPAGFMPALDAGWNLLAYTDADAAAPAAVFADLLAADELLYVTGFDGGVSIYDPAGLPFLNSLSAMENGFGYWVKTVADFNGMDLDDVGLSDGGAVSGTKANPAFDFLNGVSDLDDWVGAFVEVLGPDGAAVGRMEVLPGGMLMTSAIYGDDPTTEAVEGLQAGDALHFAFNGRIASETAVWQGAMAHLKLDLHFEAAAALAVFPNPVEDESTIQFVVPEAGRVRLELRDAAGRLVSIVLDQEMAEGNQQVLLDAASLTSGIYSLVLRCNDQQPVFAQIAIH
jgi:hypothetical protein